MIDSIEDIIKLACAGETNWKQYGNVTTKESGDLILFNYTQEAVYAAEWNFFERVSRGLIIDRVKGEVAARPFDKFFNWGEGGRTTDAPIVSVTEKIDGSLGVLYRQDGKHKIATRGSFDGEQAQWATFFLQKNYPDLFAAEEYTLLFEIVYPSDRKVVNYDGLEGLYLLAARNRFDGTYAYPASVRMYARTFGFLQPSNMLAPSVDGILELCKRIGPNQEGWVAEFADGQRFKFKGDAYLEIHRMITGLSFNRVLESVANGTIEDVRRGLPEEYLTLVDGWVSAINTRVLAVSKMVESIYSNAPKDTRKDFALYARQFPDLQKYLFLRLDGKDYKPVIYRHEDFGVKSEPLVQEG